MRQRRDFPVLHGQRLGTIEHQHQEVGSVKRAALALDADPFYRVIGLGDAGGIDQYDGHATEISRLF